jgi:3-hydroxyisobutyrate dehydrogenase
VKIGICGIGRMGLVMAERLIDEGQSVCVWNRTASKVALLVEKGAKQAQTPAQLIDSCDIVISMLFDDSAQKVVYEGTDGLLSAGSNTALIVDMGTMTPDAAIALGKITNEAGFNFLECPVGGTVAPARAGKLLGMAGGNQADFDLVKPVFEMLCRRVELVGNVGSGAAMKLAINLPLATYWEALGESLSLAIAGGVEPELAGSMMADSSGAISVAAPRIPMIVEAMNEKPSNSGPFDINGVKKDLSLMRQWARKNGHSIPLADSAHTAYAAAANDGWGANDVALMAAWRYRKNKGT